ncbi:hypothetical protein HKW98_06890 [Stutzerimonas urumqiensis]|uniref:hypothetical protein n=1 Tax=Stutzerimonas urumqiensis TaxID=638269 RepID=UPI003BA8E825
MKTKLQTVLGGIALASTVAIAAPAFADDNLFHDWDADSSGVLDYSEWDAGFDDENLMTSWDEDGDGMVSNDEYSQGLFESYDADNSGDWNDKEYEMFRDDAGDGGIFDV